MVSFTLRISRPTVRKHLKTEIEPVYQRQSQPFHKLGEFKAVLTQWLETEAQLFRNQRRTAMRLFEGLADEGYTGAYDSVQRFVKQWKIDSKNTPSIKQAFVPLVFKPRTEIQGNDRF